MRGIWIWPADAAQQDNILHKVAREDEMLTIMEALDKSPNGLSNAQLDNLLSNNSQWRTLLHMRELTSLGFVRYSIPYFGNAGQYQLTDLGRSAVARIKAGLPPVHPDTRPDYSLMARFRWDWS